MRRAAPLALLLFASAPLLAQEDHEPGEWSVKPGTQLRLRWEFTLDEKAESRKYGKQFRRETRTVTALLVCEKGLKRTGSFLFKVDTVAWTVDTEDYTVTASKASKDAAPKIDQTIKDPDTEAGASQEAEEMEEYAQAAYRLLVRPGRKDIQVKTHNGWAGGGAAASIFNRCYVHSDLPDELQSTKRWIDEREGGYLPLYSEPGNDEQLPKVKLKLTVGAGVASAKGSGKANYTGLTPMNWKYAGQSSLKRSFKCSAKGHRLESSEDAKSKVKRVDQSGPGKSSGQVTIKQTLKLTPVD
jgi:hypothetical protein